MSKFYYYYGAINSSKTMQLLSTAHNYESQGKKVSLVKPSLDTRAVDVVSRVGLSRKADVIVSPDMDLDEMIFRSVSKSPNAVLVDECQFLTRDQILKLTTIADVFNIPVIAYGLLTDFQGNLFEGSKACVEYADQIKEIKTVCQYCDKKALFNLRLQGNKPIFEGDQVEVGDVNESEELHYKPVCRKCYKEALSGRIKLNRMC